jgi:MFS family permease
VIFYGWWVVASCFFISLYTAGVVHFGFTAIFEPIANEFDWNYTQISLAASLRGLETGLLAPLVGFLVDRWGPRRLIFGGSVVSGFGCILLSRVDSLGMFYTAFILIAIGMSACSATVFLTAVANWFRRNVGIATGIMTSGFALGGLMVPVVATLVDTYGWRNSVAGLGLGIWVIALPLSLLVRHKPEQYGHLPDGDISMAVADETDPATEKSADADASTGEALKSRAFWCISLALMCQMMLINAVIVHVMPYLSSINMTRSISSLIASGVPVASILGRLGFGWSADRINKKLVAVASFVLTSLGLLAFGYAGAGTWALLPFIILFGIGWGGSVTMRVALLREHFGRSRFGTIHGFTLGIIMIGNILGPPVAGWIFDKWGSYQGAWFAFAALPVVSIVLVAAIPRLGTSSQTPIKHEV